MATNLDDVEAMAEVCTWHLRGRVYYQHEAGFLFSADLLIPGGLERAPRLEDDGLPTAVDVYAPRPGSAMEARLDAWTDLCDLAVVRAAEAASAALVGRR